MHSFSLLTAPSYYDGPKRTSLKVRQATSAQWRDDDGKQRFIQLPRLPAHPIVLQGSIDMEEAVKIEANQDWTGPQKAKHPFVFTIETKSGRVYYLSASNKDVMIAWVEKLSSTFKYFLLNNSDDSAATSMPALARCGTSRP